MEEPTGACSPWVICAMTSLVSKTVLLSLQPQVSALTLPNPVQSHRAPTHIDHATAGLPPPYCSAIESVVTEPRG